jgi:Ca2+-transporting ATPase
MEYYTEDVKALYRKFNSTPNGLSSKRASLSLAHYGPNELKKTKGISPITIFLNQFKSFIIYILFFALFVSLFLGYTDEDPKEKFDSYVDAGVIATILFINAVLGFLQEYRAEKSLDALKRLAGLKAKVLRNGMPIEINATQIVPGDIILLETGDKVPADCRLIETYSLETQEAALTGESMPVVKDTKTISKIVGLGERKNVAYSGTIITKGRGKALVCATGMDTEIGKIARLIQEQEQGMTPLQQKLEYLGTWMGISILAIVTVMFLIGIANGVEIKEMFMSAIALAVAAVPEGLPAIVTISLALGIQRMIEKNALIRKLSSVETLGSTTVICTDKTGTLTKNEMTVRSVYANGEITDISGSGYSLEGNFTKDPQKIELLLKCGALCNDAILNDTVIGDPTEGALIVSAAKAGIIKADLLKKSPRINEIPFDSERKMMSTVHKEADCRTMYTKGAPEKVLKACKSILIDGNIEKLTEQMKENLMTQNNHFAKKALRVLGFAYKELDGTDPKEDDMTFLGLQAMIDPPREEAKLAIEKCKSAGIKVVMITGDHKETAIAIARELGIEGKAITGEELEKIFPLKEQVEEIGIYARVDPEHKLRIVQALQERGHIVAMTGDGINDAPALKKSDIGIAMGITGTDVAKEASHMILTDDNFASIVNAVEEGRIIYDNIKKFVFYLVSSNLGEVLTLFLAILISAFSPATILVLPLLAVHLLWMNLLTDGLPALALGVDKPDLNIMDRKPRPKNEHIITTYNIVIMVSVAAIMALVSLLMFYKYSPENNPMYAQTIAFTTLVMLQMFNVLNATSETESIFTKGIFSNLYLILAITASLSLQAMIMYVPALTRMFKIVPLTAGDWLYITIASSLILLLGESIKLIKRNNYYIGRSIWQKA